MNKQLITTYFEEFKHWLNGGNVQVYYKKDDEPKWLTDEECIEYEGHDNFSHLLQNSLEPDDVLIIIDDEYIEFREALAEGKTIEYLDYRKEWKNLVEHCSRLDAVCLSRLRIKPEEPKFKVGDWVIYNGKYKQVTKVVDGYIDSLDNEVAVIMKEESLELWEPKLSEWCWYSKWDKIVCVEFYLCKYVLDMNEVEPEYKHKYEPFIGQLPTYLKK